MNGIKKAGASFFIVPAEAKGSMTNKEAPLITVGYENPEGNSAAALFAGNLLKPRLSSDS
jgi:hypothetical protein